MAKQKITKDGPHQYRIEAHKQSEIDKLKEARAECDKLNEKVGLLAEDIFKKHPMAKSIRKICPDAKVSISRRSHPVPYVYDLSWADEHEKSSGLIRLTGNPRRRAVALYKKIYKASAKRHKAQRSVNDWRNRKSRFLAQRLSDIPELLDLVKDIAEIAFRSEPFNFHYGKKPKPGPLPIKGGIDSGKMWESQSIGNEADPKTAAMVLIECFNEPWINELRKELHLQSRPK